MNYLAHLYLSCENEQHIVGNFMTDFINLSEMKSMPKAISEGIKLHQAIDHFTDTHPSFIQSKIRLRPRHGKYAPVLLDILYDHLLAVNWKKYSGITLEDFSIQMYEVLNKYMSYFPNRIQGTIQKMISHDFLTAYRDEARFRYILKGMDKRAKYKSDFESGWEDLTKDFNSFNEEFNTFFPDIIDYIENNVHKHA